MGELIVIGSSNTDLVVKCPKLPKPGETVLGGKFQVFAGGKGANQAVAAARMGADVYFVGAVGGDDFGRARLEDLKKEGIDINLVKTANADASGVALILLGEHAENIIAVAPGSNTNLTKDDIDKAFVELTGVNTVLIQLEIPMEAVEHAAELCKKDGRTLVLNPAPCPAKGLSKTLLKSAAIITPNQTEFEMLGGPSVKNPKDAKQLKAAVDFIKSAGINAVVLTMGKDGALVFEKGKEPIHVPAPKVEPVDTVGAGDCLNGTIAAELADGSALKSAVELAVVAAAIKVTRSGAQAGMPKKEEVLRFKSR